MFPESPQLLHSIAHSHGPHSHYQLQQLSPSDFRPRTASNASSLGRLSPIPAVPESEVADGPWSPQDYPSRVFSQQQQSGSNAGDRFNPDQLVENIAESMKIRENGFPSSSSIAANGGGINSQQHSSSSSSSSSSTTPSSNGYSLCHPPNYGASSYSSQHSQQQHQEFRSPTSSSSAGRTASNGLMTSQQQQQRILSNDLSQAPPPYSIASLQVRNYHFLPFCFLVKRNNVIDFDYFLKFVFLVRRCHRLRVFDRCHLLAFSRLTNRHIITATWQILVTVALEAYLFTAASVPPLLSLLHCLII